MNRDNPGTDPNHVLTAGIHRDAWADRYGTVLHRGVRIGMTPERADRFRAASSPEERAAIVMEHLQAPPRMPSGSLSYREGWGGLTGQHWSRRYSLARGFSRPNPGTQKQLREIGLPEDVPVIMHAELPRDSQRWTRRGQTQHGHALVSEDEVTFRAGAPVQVTGISFPGLGEYGKPGTDRPDQYVPLTAKLRAGKGVR